MAAVLFWTHLRWTHLRWAHLVLARPLASLASQRLAHIHVSRCLHESAHSIAHNRQPDAASFDCSDSGPSASTAIALSSSGLTAVQLHLVLQQAGIGERAAQPASVRAVRAAALPSLPLHNVLCHRIWARLLRDGPLTARRSTYVYTRHRDTDAEDPPPMTELFMNMGPRHSAQVKMTHCRKCAGECCRSTAC